MGRLARRRTPGQRVGGDSGAQTVEFALILPVLVLLVLGIINFGYLFGQKLSLNQAVREGTRMAVVPGQDNGDSVNSTAEIQQLVRDSTGGLVTTSNVTVVVKKDSSGATITAGCGSTGMSVGDQLRVEATYPATSLVRLPLPGFPSTFNLKSTAVYRCEW